MPRVWRNIIHRKPFFCQADQSQAAEGDFPDRRHCHVDQRRKHDPIRVRADIARRFRPVANCRFDDCVINYIHTFHTVLNL